MNQLSSIFTHFPYCLWNSNCDKA